MIKAHTNKKHTALSPDAQYLAVGSTDNSVAILRFPSLEEIESIKLDSEVVDLDWGGEGGSWVSCCTCCDIITAQRYES